MSNLQAYIANFIGHGRDCTRYESHIVRDALSLTCGKFRIDLFQRRDIVSGKKADFVGRFIATTEARVLDVHASDVEEALKAVDRVCWLLSFISQSGVVRYGYSYPRGSENYNERSVAGVANCFRPVIDVMDGAKTVIFFEQCYETT